MKFMTILEKIKNKCSEKNEFFYYKDIIIKKVDIFGLKGEYNNWYEASLVPMYKYKARVSFDGNVEKFKEKFEFDMDKETVQDVFVYLKIFKRMKEICK